MKELCELFERIMRLCERKVLQFLCTSLVDRMFTSLLYATSLTLRLVLDLSHFQRDCFPVYVFRSFQFLAMYFKFTKCSNE